MKRMFGMMPSKEVKIQRTFKDENDLTITVQAGPNGWTVLWADGGSDYKDKESTSEQNYIEAIEYLNKEGFSNLKLVK